MIQISKETVLLLHQFLIDTLGGSHGIRDNGLLESALSMPFMTFDGNDLYASLEQKAAQLCFGLVKNHPFIDGNKRIGALCMEELLELNGVALQYDGEYELSDCILAVAQGQMDSSDLSSWIKAHRKEPAP